MILAIVACVAQAGWMYPAKCTETYDTVNDYGSPAACMMRYEDVKNADGKTLQDIMEKDGDSVVYHHVCIDWKGDRKSLGNYLIRNFGNYPREKA